MSDANTFAAQTLNAILSAKIKDGDINTLPKPEDVEKFIVPLHAALLAMYQNRLIQRSTPGTLAG